MAELIGLEIEDDSLDNIEEGSEFYSLVKQRERNPRNRILCFSVHSPKCFVCDSDPSQNMEKEKAICWKFIMLNHYQNYLLLKHMILKPT